MERLERKVRMKQGCNELITDQIVEILNCRDAACGGGSDRECRGATHENQQCSGVKDLCKSSQVAKQVEGGPDRECRELKSIR